MCIGMKTTCPIVLTLYDVTYPVFVRANLFVELYNDWEKDCLCVGMRKIGKIS